MTEKPFQLKVVLLLLLVLGAGLRLFDLTDQPIDFHPTRQLRGMIVARGMYYQMLPNADPDLRQRAMTFWESTGQYEPSILERLSALAYLAAGQEIPWVARIINTLFWMLGGLALWGLGRRLIPYTAAAPSPERLRLGGAMLGAVILAWFVNMPNWALPALIGLVLVAGWAQSMYRQKRYGPWAKLPPRPIIDTLPYAALIALALYLLLPFSVQASRSFQPDPGMVMWMALTAYAMWRWSEGLTWRWALAAGVCAGLALLTKAISAYTVGGGMIALTLYTFGVGRERPFYRPILRLVSSLQVWAMLGLSIVPTVIYYLTRQDRAAEFLSTWTVALSHLLVEPMFYLKWLGLVADLITAPLLLMAIAGVLLARGRARWLLAGLWLGYIAYGLFLPYQMNTHSYYHLQVVWLAALSSIPAWQAITDMINVQAYHWRWIPFAIAAMLAAYFSWQALVPLYGQDYRNEPAYWSEIASYLPQDGKIIALTQDYGYRLMYYGWRKVILWPNRGEIKLSDLRGSSKEFEEYFAKRTQDVRYFLITAFNQYDDQPALKDMLTQHYPVVVQTQGYLIFDLSKK
jgi:hypothetical protein